MRLHFRSLDLFFYAPGRCNRLGKNEILTGGPSYADEAAIPLHWFEVRLPPGDSLKGRESNRVWNDVLTGDANLFLSIRSAHIHKKYISTA